MMEKELITLVQQHKCLYDLQHNDYDNNQIKDSVWKEIASKLCISGKFQWKNAAFFVLSTQAAMQVTKM